MDTFLELGVIVGIAALVSLILRVIKQPPIIAYLITGIIVGPLFLNLMHSTSFIELLAHLGVAFLLFIVGLSLDFKVLRQVGGISIVAGVGAMAAVSALSFLIALRMGFAYTPALYLGAALAFSSTVVVVKLLSDKREIDTLHGRIALGILIVEDFVAALMLMIVPVAGTGDVSLIFFSLGKGVLLIIGVFVFSYLVLPMLFSLAAKTQETLYLASIAWALLIAIVFSYLGFSLEIGALLAGIALASSKYSLEISNKMKSLRDFFIVLFFVYFGSQLAGPLNAEIIIEACVFSAFILVGKPLIVMGFMRAFGYKKRTNFFAGVGLAQISEFSLILVLLGHTLGVVPQSLLSLTILIALITIAISSYSIYYSHAIFRFLSPLLAIFEGNKFDTDDIKKDKVYDIVLFGYNRIGFNLVKSFNKAHKKFIIVDYNPQTILELSRQGINCIYGDAHDLELLHELRLNEAKIIISTIPDFEANVAIRKSITSHEVMFIATSHGFEDTERLYASGADYVIMPHFLGGAYVADLLLTDHFSKNLLMEEGRKQRRELKERVKEGQDHPSKDKYGR
jgi:Kef-type K+ transport system membrane component KefB/Trk K+ transport system NAD-binding subunit